MNASKYFELKQIIEVLNFFDFRQQMQEQSGSRDDPSSLEATFGMG